MLLFTSSPIIYILQFVKVLHVGYNHILSYSVDGNTDLHIVVSNKFNVGSKHCDVVEYDVNNNNYTLRDLELDTINTSLIDDKSILLLNADSSYRYFDVFDDTDIVIQKCQNLSPDYSPNKSVAATVTITTIMQ